ncbi:hypothetical protein [Xanthomarina spongicola]|jgi:hypothetical protein|uniref:Uncharacterized protein n=1 Tax=Xanthomarina spongicola TaxID=570520 RepID=A0A316DM17_9FLAO|nr:hypothetical protein [Xanthomarina spongicola]PWK18945.1 hypothetical protein LX78_01420 [Xanthomarina spongicola]
MEEKFITIKEVVLNNNCPECYNNSGLHLTFKQKFVETKFYKSITKENTHQLECHNCNTSIYPISWTEDIERVFNYHQKAFTPKKPSTKLKKSAWFLIIGVLILILVLVGFIVFPNL